MQRLEVSDVVRPIYGSLGVKRLMQCRLLMRLKITVQADKIFHKCCIFTAFDTVLHTFS